MTRLPWDSGSSAAAILWRKSRICQVFSKFLQVSRILLTLAFAASSVWPWAPRGSHHLGGSFIEDADRRPHRQCCVLPCAPDQARDAMRALSRRPPRAADWGTMSEFVSLTGNAGNLVPGMFAPAGDRK